MKPQMYQPWLMALVVVAIGCGVGGEDEEDPRRCRVDADALWVDQEITVVSGALEEPFICPVGMETYTTGGISTEFAATIRAPFQNLDHEEFVYVLFLDSDGSPTQACGGITSCSTPPQAPLPFGWFAYDDVLDQTQPQGLYWGGRNNEFYTEDNRDSALVQITTNSGNAFGWAELPYTFTLQAYALNVDPPEPDANQWVTISADWRNALDPTPYIEWRINDVLQSDHDGQLVFLTEAGATYEIVMDIFDSDTSPSTAENRDTKLATITIPGGGSGGGGSGGDDDGCLFPPCP